MKKQFILALYITDKCNFKCNYCFVKKGNRVMDIKIAKEAIEYFAKENQFEIMPTFLGGEPLIEWPLIKEIVAFSEMKGISKFNLATNGLLVDEEKIDYFFNHNFKIQLSFDGIKESHNYSRKKINGSDTFHELQKKLQLFLKYSNKISLELRMTITRQNLIFLSKSIIFFLKEGVKTNKINIMPVIKERWEESDFYKLREETKVIRKYYETLRIVPNLFINECIDRNHANISCLSDKCSCGFGSRVVCVDCNGKVYSCFIPVGLTESKKQKFLIGDLKKMIKLNSLKGNNNYLSCPVWSILYGTKALDIYKRVYRIWGGK